MSLESAKAFLAKINEDKTLQAQLKEVDSEEKFFAVVKSGGFDFTKEEWLNTKTGFLTDADLANVAGGGTMDLLGKTSIIPQEIVGDHSDIPSCRWWPGGD